MSEPNTTAIAIVENIVARLVSAERRHIDEIGRLNSKLAKAWAEARRADERTDKANDRIATLGRHRDIALSLLTPKQFARFEIARKASDEAEEIPF